MFIHKVLLKQNYNESNKEKENTENKNRKTYKKLKNNQPYTINVQKTKI